MGLEPRACGATRLLINQVEDLPDAVPSGGIMRYIQPTRHTMHERHMRLIFTRMQFPVLLLSLTLSLSPFFSAPSLSLLRDTPWC
jgi:hypothetical protein